MNEFNVNSLEVTSLAVLNDGHLVSRSMDATIIILKSINWEKVRSLKGHSGWIRCLVVHKENRVISGSVDRAVKVWNANGIYRKH